MIVDESPLVEPLSCKEKILQPALGCDEQEMESCIECTCYCTNNSSNNSSSSSSNNRSSNNAGGVVNGEETTRVDAAAAAAYEEQEDRQRNHEKDDVDDDDEDVVNITTFIDMIKTIFAMRWREIDYDDE